MDWSFKRSDLIGKEIKRNIESNDSGGAHVKYKKSVYRSLALITQFGINMLVPIFLCVMAGIWLGRKFSVEWITIPFFAVGALAGFRNIFIMAKKIYANEDTDRSDKEERDHAEKN